MGSTDGGIPRSFQGNKDLGHEFTIIARTKEYRERDGQHGARVVICRRCDQRLDNWPMFLHECSRQMSFNFDVGRRDAH